MSLGSAVGANVRVGTPHMRALNPFTVATLAVIALALARSPAFAGELDTVFAFNISAQSLDKALLQFGAQAHVQISFAWNLSTATLQVHEIKGRYTRKEALAEILSGTNLGYIVHGNTFEIVPFAAHGSNAEDQARKPSHFQRLGEKQNANNPQQVPPDPLISTRSSETSQLSQTLSEVIVTAQKYRQRAFDVPISLDVISGTELLKYGITNLSSLQYDVPGLYMNSSGYSQAVYIRGVANDSGNGAVVGQYIDEADITAEDTSGQAGLATGDAGLYDLERVEVLKGPQGTLYGDGSMGGVIRYITNKPALDGFQMSADTAAMVTEDGAASQRIETMLNTPIVTGSLGLRFAGIFEHDGGWVDEPIASLKDINGSNLQDVRAEALWKPTDRFEVNAMEIIHRHNTGLGMGEDVSGNITPIFYTTLVPNQEDDSNLSNVTISFDMGAVRALSSTSYLKETETIHNLMVSTPLGSQTFWTMYPQYFSRNSEYSEEFRLSRSDSGSWQWTVGGFYRHFHDQISYSDYSGFAGSTLLTAFFSPAIPFGDTSASKAAFANTSYRFFDRFTAGVGLRYSSDRETDFPEPQALTFTSTDPRIYFQYRAASEANVYVSAAKGFRSGGFNYPSEPGYEPESLWSYDLGTKISLFERRVRAEVDLFYMNYYNYVNLTYVPPQYENTNIGKARIKGADADLTWRPTALWQLRLSAELLKTEFLTASDISGYVAGDRLPFAPSYSFTASVTRNFQLSDKPGEVELYYYEISRVQDRTLGDPLEQSSIQQILNLRATVDWNENLEFGLFAHNLLNDRGSESPWAYFGESVRPRPRTVGINFDVHFR